MKLFMHWLLWDLRRFRVMLWVWTLLILGYAVFLGWLQQNFLTSDPSFFAASLPAAAGLVLLGFCQLLRLATADPAAGTASFWKLRPPAGWAVAGSKWVIGLGFYVMLPALFFLVSSAPTLPAGAGFPAVFTAATGWLPMALTGLAWISLGAAVAGSPFQAVVRMGVAVTFLAAGMLTVNGLAAAGILELGFRFMNHPILPWLALAVGAGYFVLARRSRNAHPALLPLTVTMPLVLGLVQNALVRPTNRTDLERSVPFQDAGAVPVPAAGGTPLRNVAVNNFSYEAYAESPRTRRLAFVDSTMRFGGLPPETRVMARWLDLKLIAPDGKTAQARMEFAGNSSVRNAFAPAGKVGLPPAPFLRGELMPLSRAACRAEGTVRLMLAAPETSILQLRSGLEQASRFGKHRLQRSTQGSSLLSLRQGMDVTHGWWASPPFLESRLMTAYALRHWHSGESIPMVLTHHPMFRGFLLPMDRTAQWLRSDPEAPPLASARAERDDAAGNLEAEWGLQMSSFLPYAVMDLPVALDLVVPPRLSDPRPAAELISAIQLDPSASSSNRRRLLGYAFILANREALPFVGDSHPVHDHTLAALRRLLEKVPESGLPDLLWIASENPPVQPNFAELHDGPLRQRIAALITLGDLPSLKAETALWKYLRKHLIAAGLVAVEEGNHKEWAEWDDVALERTWQEARRQPHLPTAVLEEAVRRGLTWSLPAVAEILDLIPGSEAARDLRKLMKGITILPDDAGDFDAWIRQQAGVLVFNPQWKRWVLPPVEAGGDPEGGNG